MIKYTYQLSSLILLFAVACAPSVPEREQQQGVLGFEEEDGGLCEETIDCPTGYVCNGGQCSRVDEDAECITDSDCPLGTICNLSGQCVGENGESPDACESSADCGTFEICQDNVCTSIDTSCEADTDCNMIDCILDGNSCQCVDGQCQLTGDNSNNGGNNNDGGNGNNNNNNNADGESGQVACVDGQDNDGDSLIDCDDPGCQSLQVCQEPQDNGGGNNNGNGGSEAGDFGMGCADGIDGDGDGLVDCDDPDCLNDIVGAFFCLDGGGGSSGPTETCNDGIQNQGEEGVDCGGPCAACPVETRAPQQLEMFDDRMTSFLGCQNFCGSGETRDSGNWVNDGVCDDGLEGSANSLCRPGSDCIDCGARNLDFSQPFNVGGYKIRNENTPSQVVTLPADMNLYPGDVVVLTRGMYESEFSSHWSGLNFADNVWVKNVSGEGYGQFYVNGDDRFTLMSPTNVDADGVRTDYILSPALEDGGESGMCYHLTKSGSNYYSEERSEMAGTPGTPDESLPDAGLFFVISEVSDDTIDIDAEYIELLWAP